MGKKTIWAICTLNILASGFAIAWVTRPYWQARPKPATPAFELAKAPPKEAEASWADFASANTYDSARKALAGMPSAPERQARLREFLGVGEARATTDLSAVAAARRAAALAFWGDAVETGSGDDAWLRELALDLSRSPLERETALRATVLAAQRRHKASAEENAEGWREAFAAFLQESDFGRGSSVEGLALQARAFSLAEKIAPIDRGGLIERIRLLLLPRNGASEPVVLAALDVARQLGAKEVLDAARAVARQPGSDACLQAALGFLVEQGNTEDLSWLDGYIPASASLQINGANSRAALAARLATQSAVTAAATSASH